MRTDSFESLRVQYNKYLLFRTPMTLTPQKALEAIVKYINDESIEFEHKPEEVQSFLENIIWHALHLDIMASREELYQWYDVIRRTQALFSARYNIKPEGLAVLCSMVYRSIMFMNWAETDVCMLRVNKRRWHRSWRASNWYRKSYFWRWRYYWYGFLDWLHGRDLDD